MDRFRVVPRNPFHRASYSYAPETTEIVHVHHHPRYEPRPDKAAMAQDRFWEVVPCCSRNEDKPCVDPVWPQSGLAMQNSLEI